VADSEHGGIPGWAQSLRAYSVDLPWRSSVEQRSQADRLATRIAELAQVGELAVAGATGIPTPGLDAHPRQGCGRRQRLLSTASRATISIFSHAVTSMSQIVLRPSYRPNPPGTKGVTPVVLDLLLPERSWKGRLIMPNVNVTYAEMQAAARQLQAGEQTIEGDLTRLKHLVDNLVAGGYVTDSSSRHFEASYTQFHSGATKMLQGLTGMGQYLDAAVKAFSDTDTQLAAALKQ
jgi:WXG100 family type VII secretion target